MYYLVPLIVVMMVSIAVIAGGIFELYLITMLQTFPFLSIKQQEYQSSAMNALRQKRTEIFRMGRPTPLRLESSAFPQRGLLPAFYHYNNCNCNPPIEVMGLPPLTRSLCVLLEQPGTPIAARTHWVCWDLPAERLIETAENRGIQGKNDFLHLGYTGPSFNGSLQVYRFIVYAVRGKLYLPAGASRYQAERMFSSQALAIGDLSFYA